MVFRSNKRYSKKYWDLLKTTKWIQNSQMPQYSVFETIIVENPNFNDLNSLSEKIKNELIQVSDEILTSLKLLE